MKIEFDEIKNIHLEDVEFEEDGQILTANVIKTQYIPTSFKGTTKNFCLRENHHNSEFLHNNFKSKCITEWIEELGYDTDQYEMDISTKEIVKKNELKYNFNNHIIENISVKNSTEI